MTIRDLYHTCVKNLGQGLLLKDQSSVFLIFGCLGKTNRTKQTSTERSNEFRQEKVAPLDYFSFKVSLSKETSPFTALSTLLRGKFNWSTNKRHTFFYLIVVNFHIKFGEQFIFFFSFYSSIHHLSFFHVNSWEIVCCTQSNNPKNLSSSILHHPPSLLGLFVGFTSFSQSTYFGEV